MADETNGSTWTTVLWMRLVLGSIGAGVGNYLILAGVGVQGKLAILSGVLGACSYGVAFIQNPTAPPAVPVVPQLPKKP